MSVTFGGALNLPRKQHVSLDYRYKWPAMTRLPMLIALSTTPCSAPIVGTKAPGNCLSTPTMTFNRLLQTTIIYAALGDYSLTSWDSHKEAFFNAWETCLDDWKKEMLVLEKEDADKKNNEWQKNKITDDDMAAFLDQNEMIRNELIGTLDACFIMIESHFTVLLSRITNDESRESAQADYTEIQDMHFNAEHQAGVTSTFEERKEERGGDGTTTASSSLFTAGTSNGVSGSSMTGSSM